MSSNPSALAGGPEKRCGPGTLQGAAPYQIPWPDAAPWPCAADTSDEQGRGRASLSLSAIVIWNRRAPCRSRASWNATARDLLRGRLGSSRTTCPTASGRCRAPAASKKIGVAFGNLAWLWLKRWYAGTMAHIRRGNVRILRHARVWGGLAEGGAHGSPEYRLYLKTGTPAAFVRQTLRQRACTRSTWRICGRTHAAYICGSAHAGMAKIDITGKSLAACALVFGINLVACVWLSAINEGWHTLEAWMLHTAFWGCAYSAIYMAVIIVERYYPRAALRRRSKPTNAIRKSLHRRMTHAPPDDQLIFTAPLPGRVKDLRWRR